MAKEWDKFQADYKKLAPSIKKYAYAEAAAYSVRMRTAHANCSEGETYLSETMVTARKNGVTGSGLNDFIKDKGFKEALGLLDKAANMLTEATRDFEKFCLEAGDVAAEVGKLADAIEKDLKGRKDSSASKKDIEALLAQAADDRKDLLKSSKYYGEKVNGAILNYAKNFQKTVATIMSEAPAAQEKAKDATELPQLFVDRNIKKNFGQAIADGKSIGELCSSAIDKAANAGKDALAAAKPDLTAAAEVLSGLKKLHDDYARATSSFKDALDNSKDKDKIEKMIAAIQTAYEDSDRRFRGTLTTIKKAG